MEDHGQTDTPAAPMAATAAFVDALTAAGVQHGIMDEAIHGLCLSGADHKTPRARPRRATPPVHGGDGSIEYSVDLDKRAGRLLPDGSIDLRERNSAVVVTTGQIFARVTGSTVGEDG